MLIAKRKNGGFLVLTMVLLVCAVVLAISTGIMLRSIGEVNKSADLDNSVKAWGAVTGCAEYALLQMSTTSGGMLGWNYASTTGELLENVGDGGNSCYIYPVTASGTAKVIKASSTVSFFTRKLLIEIATNTPNILVNSWDEVADFE